MNNMEHRLELSERIPLIGREEELKRLESYLHAPGSERHFVYYWARGGLGKTRLLEELERIVEEAGPGFHFSGIIDLYHTDTHSTSDLERIIVEGLASGQSEKEYFKAYRYERSVYELLRERGTDPGILEQRRAKLADLFIEGCREMALDARKLVICFDTVELLQYESSIVEEKAGLNTADSRVKPWLLEKLSQLTNVLVVFAGRPKLPAPGEEFDPQARLVADMEKAFGKDLIIVELQPFTLEETRIFFDVLGKGSDIISSSYLPIVHWLTGGRPIFLHLIGDRLQVLAPESRTILELFDDYAELVDAPDDKRLEKAREQVEHRILDAVFNNSGEIGGYLTRIAMMPKGVDAEILHVVLGLPMDEAKKLLEALMPLSFVKQYKALQGGVRLHEAHVFLHDELYRLLTLRDVIPYLRMNERSVANTLVQNYYEPRIQELEARLAQAPAEERVKLREQLQKLQVERVYYLLVSNSDEGYEEYKRLTDEANRHRWVGFGMRLLDEFLRFYNRPERRKLFEAMGVPRDQVVRESAWMWVERFDWWGQDERVIKLAECILNQPEDFSICSGKGATCSDEDLAIMGNIYAFWTGARARIHGYDPGIVERATKMSSRLPGLEACTPEQALARARLSTAIGYQFRLGGIFDQAIESYVDAKAAFRKLEGQLTGYEEEYTLLLTSLSVVYAKQGRMALAHPLAYDALRINEKMGNEYSTGLTLATLSEITQMLGNYDRALEYGEEALKLFQELGDARGVALAYMYIARAKRWRAKYELEKGREQKLGEVHQKLKQARIALEKALEEAQQARIGSVIPDLHAELGRVHRETGHLARRLDYLEKDKLNYYRQAEDQLHLALNTKEWGIAERADILQDLSEVLFNSGAQDAAQKCLQQLEDLIGPEYLIIPGEQVPNEGLSHEYFEPLGKAELLRGHNAFEHDDLAEGVKHYILAYAYFMHFSSKAVEHDKMIEYLYNYMRDSSVEKHRAVMEEVHAWIDENELGVDVSAFVQTLANLLGV